MPTPLLLNKSGNAVKTEYKIFAKLCFKKVDIYE